MLFSRFVRLKATFLTGLFQTPAFALVNRNFVERKSFKCGRFQHSSKQMDWTENKTSSTQKSVSKGLEVDEEGLIKKKTGQINPMFPLKQLTKSAKIFETVAISSANEQGFCEAIEIFKKRDIKRLRLMDFISTALSYMEPFDVSKSVGSYNQLLELFPKGRYHNRTVFDTLWTRHRPQIDCAVQVLTKLEENGVRPNVDTYDIIHAIFGNDSIPLNKLRRIVFWFDKFDEMYPDPLPKELPSNKQDLFKIAINQMIADEFIVSLTYKKSEGVEQETIGAENKNLSDFLADYDLAKPVFLEGPQILWLRKTKIHYYVLKADVNPNLRDEDQFLAMCILEDNEVETKLKFWIKELQKKYSRLSELNIIFNIYSHNDKL